VSFHNSVDIALVCHVFRNDRTTCLPKATGQ
jgi:hypothetical protein